MTTYWFEEGEDSARSSIIGSDSAGVEEAPLIEDRLFDFIVVLETGIIGINNEDLESLMNLNRL